MNIMGNNCYHGNSFRDLIALSSTTLFGGGGSTDYEQTGLVEVVNITTLNVKKVDIIIVQL